LTKALLIFANIWQLLAKWFLNFFLSKTNILSFSIDDVYKEEIERRSKESRQAAVDMLLGHIRHSSEQGKWQNFIEALDNNGKYHKNILRYTNL
jgi:hypothetical protein